jgi:hypothetical protein
MEEKEKKIEKVNLVSVPEEFHWLIESGFLTEEGLRIQGMGIVIRKMEAMNELIDKTNLKLHFIEKKLESLNN